MALSEKTKAQRRDESVYTISAKTTGCKAHGVVISTDCLECPLDLCRYDTPGGSDALTRYLVGLHGMPVHVASGEDTRGTYRVAMLAKREGVSESTIYERLARGYPGRAYRKIRNLRQHEMTQTDIRAQAVQRLALRDGIAVRSVYRRLARGYYQNDPDGAVYAR